MRQVFGIALILTTLAAGPVMAADVGFACAPVGALSAASTVFPASSLEWQLNTLGLTDSERVGLNLQIVENGYAVAYVPPEDNEIRPRPTQYHVCGFWPLRVAAMIWERNCAVVGKYYSGDGRGGCAPA